ncbi:MAG TPA: SDR family oxidoreductase, partial [Desulfobacterales bacterium]|nr:SDR family oxidoreductase [Desulfobacterales bacterium]
MQVDLDGKVAFVAGSTSGIGKAVALKLARNQADIVLNGRNSAQAEEVIKEIGQIGRNVIFEKADITNYREVAQAMQNAVAKLGKVDILVASGGINKTGIRPTFFHETDPIDYLSIAKNQWWSRLYCIKAILAHMIKRKTGKIVMVTTDAGRWPTPAESVVGGAAAAVMLGTKVLAQELARWQIRINTVSTTVIKDSASLQYVSRSSPSLAHVFTRAFEKQPFPTTVEDVAEACLFLASPEAHGITGQVLSVNGGLSF